MVGLPVQSAVTPRSPAATVDESCGSSAPTGAQPQVAVRAELHVQATAIDAVVAQLEQVIDPFDVATKLETGRHALVRQVVDGEHGGALPVAAVGEQRRWLVFDQAAGAPAELRRLAAPVDEPGQEGQQRVGGPALRGDVDPVGSVGAVHERADENPPAAPGAHCMGVRTLIRPSSESCSPIPISSP